MKLRNKKTGQIVEIAGGWEVCYKKAPLIKDKKIRKAVRAWADANEIPSNGYVTSYGIKGNWLGLRYSYGDKDWVVKLEIDSPKVNIEQDVYTIAELCGEEGK